MNRKGLIAVGAAVVFAVIGLVALGNGSTLRAAATFEEVRHKSGALEVYGDLDPSSIRPLRGANLVAFDIVEKKTGDRLAVLYDNQTAGLPANFPTAPTAKVMGVYDPTQKRLVADRVFTKCPSKYESDAKPTLAAQNALEKWQSATGARTAGL